jgi:short-subunit dehydrogenase
MPSHTRPFAIVTGASAGIGYELAKCCAEHSFDLLIAADQPSINDAAQDFHALGVAVEAIEADLATLDGVDKLYAATQGKRLCRTRRFLGETQKSSVRHSRYCLGKGDREHGDAVYVG